MLIWDFILVWYVYLWDLFLVFVLVGVFFYIFLKEYLFIFFFFVDYDDWNDVKKLDLERRRVGGGWYLGKLGWLGVFVMI